MSGSPRIRAVVWSTAVLWTLAWASAAGAQGQGVQIGIKPAKYKLTGNLRLEVGDMGPRGVIPITPLVAPDGPVVETPNATVRQRTGPDPQIMQFDPGQLTALPVLLQLPVHLANPNLLQITSALGVTWPKAQATFQANGRTGAATVTFCPGQAVPPNGNPMCLSPNSGVQHGLMRYVRSTNQFGGPGIANMRVTPLAWVTLADEQPDSEIFSPPCVVGKLGVKPPDSFGAGAPFGFVTFGGAPHAPNLFDASVTFAGGVNPTAALGTDPGLTDAATSFGAPWTTGMVTVSVTDNTTVGPQIFVLTGQDLRVAGVGDISLVSGAVVQRASIGPNHANQGWLNLTVPESSASPGLAAALGSLAVLHVLFRLARRVRRT